MPDRRSATPTGGHPLPLWTAAAPSDTLSVMDRRRTVSTPLADLVSTAVARNRTERLAGPRSVAELAEALGVVRATLHLYLTGARRLAPDGLASVTAVSIADALGLDEEAVQDAARRTADRPV